jgi:hypothetical protein
VLRAWPLPVLQQLCDIATDLTLRVRNRRSVQSVLQRLEHLLATFDNCTGTVAAAGTVADASYGDGRFSSGIGGYSGGCGVGVCGRSFRAHDHDAEEDDGALLDSCTPYVPLEVVESGKHDGVHGNGAWNWNWNWNRNWNWDWDWNWNWWRRRPGVVAALALALVAVLVLAVELGTQLPTPVPTPAFAGPQCTGTSAHLVRGDCEVWQRFANNTMYKAWVEGMCGGSLSALLNPCSCRTIQCSASGRITELNFYAQRLPGSGGVPLELMDLTGLKLLNLGENGLQGALTPSIAQLTQLTYLHLGYGGNNGPNNKLTGTIPSELGLLSGLGYLDLSDNQLSGTLPAFDFPKLNTGCCWLDGNPFVCPLPAEADLCQDCGSHGQHSPPSCK